MKAGNHIPQRKAVRLIFVVTVKVRGLFGGKLSEKKVTGNSYISEMTIRIINKGATADSDTASEIILADSMWRINGPIYPRHMRWLSDLTKDIFNLNRGNAHDERENSA